MEESVVKALQPDDSLEEKMKLLKTTLTFALSLVQPKFTGKRNFEPKAILHIIPKPYQLKFIFDFLFVPVIHATQFKWLIGTQVLNELSQYSNLKGKT
jgi:hypothetical protein